MTIDVVVDVECKETAMTWRKVKVKVDTTAVEPDCDKLVAYIRSSPEIADICHTYLAGADELNFMVHNIDDAVDAIANDHELRQSISVE